MNSKLYLIIFALLVLYAGCSSSGSDRDMNFGAGDYSFIMKDSAGVVIAEGTMTADKVSGKDVTGTYKITKKNRDFAGMETMDGKFKAEVNETGKSVWVNTNPMIADANVYWYLTPGKYAYYGNWTYSTMRGSQSGGRITVEPR